MSQPDLAAALEIFISAYRDEEAYDAEIKKHHKEFARTD